MTLYPVGCYNERILKNEGRQMIRFRVNVRKARISGLIVIALAAAAYWGGLAWAVWSGDMALIGIYVRILGTVLAVVMPASIILALISGFYSRLVRSR